MRGVLCSTDIAMWIRKVIAREATSTLVTSKPTCFTPEITGELDA